MATTPRTWIGKDVPRLEDARLLTGRASYTDDVKVPGMAYAAVLRSPVAHARIVRIDTSRARALPGVFAVVTGEDAKELTNPLPAFCAEPVVEYALAVDKVRYAGEPVAARPGRHEGGGERTGKALRLIVARGPHELRGAGDDAVDAAHEHGALRHRQHAFPIALHHVARRRLDPAETAAVTDGSVGGIAQIM